jgi:hypothetical protein
LDYHRRHACHNITRQSKISDTLLSQLIKIRTRHFNFEKKKLVATDGWVDGLKCFILLRNNYKLYYVIWWIHDLASEEQFWHKKSGHKTQQITWRGTANMSNNLNEYLHYWLEAGA